MVEERVFIVDMRESTANSCGRVQTEPGREKRESRGGGEEINN